MSDAGLQIAHVSGERGFSGGEVQLFLLLEGLRKRGHRSLLIAPPGGAALREADQRGIETRAVAMRNDFSIGAQRRIRRILREWRPDLVHCHTGRANWLGGTAARAEGLPALSTRRMDRKVRRGLRTRWLYSAVMRRTVAISPAVGRRLIEGGVPAERIRLIWSAVDRAALVPSAPRAVLRQRLGADGGSVLLAAANLVRRKGLDVLLEALAGLPQARLWIAGDGPERPELERAARGLGGRVVFLGRRGDVPDLLEACDIFVLPSRAEGLGVAALEAMARGRPVVASDVGGLAEAVGHEQCGLLVPPGDARALRGALERLLNDPALARRLGEAGATRAAERFDAETQVAAYEALYREILAESARGAAR